MKKQRKAVSMRTKILFSCVSCMVLALLLQTLFFQRSSSQIIIGQTEEISWNTMKNLQDDIYNYLKGMENNLIKIYNQNELIRDLSLGKSEEELKRAYSQAAYDMARSDFEPTQNVAAIYIYTMGDDCISYYRHANTPIYSYPEDIYQSTVSLEDDTQRIRQYAASTDRVMLISSYYHTERKTNLLRFVLKIYRNAVKTVGYVVCDVDSKNVLQMMERYRYTGEQLIWLQPKGDRPALSVGERTPQQESSFLKISQSIQNGDWNAALSKTHSENELYEIEQRKYNLTAYSLLPRTILQKNQNALNRSMLLVAAIILVAFTVLFLIISAGLTKRLTYVVESMGRIKRGETSLRLKPMKQDEIGVLGQEFNEMLEQMEDLIAQEYEIKLLADDARYKALQAQVNPHFLYNTLDTMSAIASAKNCPDVSMLCRALSNLFRYSLNMKNPFSTLEQEILHIKNYMYVMNVRMQNSVKLEIDVESRLLGEQLPRLSLQPLVENALQHGLKEKRGAKQVRVRAAVQEDTLLIQVEDNGVGMDVQQINRQLEQSVSNALQKKSSIGLDNINARVKLLYGEPYGLRVQSELGTGSRVTLSLPRKKEEQENGDESL